MSVSDTIQKGANNVNKRALEAEMKLHGDTGGTLAEYLGMSPSTFSAKLNESGGREFTQSEIMGIKTRYNLGADKVAEIFFTEKVS